jgi:glycosyltransferase involved in cell wall biosynthesis
VIYEAFASRLPVISTPAGNVPDYRGLVEIVDTVGGMTLAVADLLGDAARRREMADRGWKLWRDHHTWESIALSYEREYERLLSA